MERITRTLGSHHGEFNEYFESILMARDQLFDQYLIDVAKRDKWIEKMNKLKNNDERRRIKRFLVDFNMHILHINLQLVHWDNRITRRSPRNKHNSPYL